MKDRLIEILNETFAEQYEKRGLLTAPHTADHLLANGVMVLPCEVGDTLWIINSYANSRLEIINRMVEPIEVESVAISKDGIEIETAEAIYFSEHFGEMIFFTKEEAEKALERSGNGTSNF